MLKCVFCGKEEKSFKGVHYIKNTGVINYFCSSKCRKNSLKLNRDKRRLKWTEAFHMTRDRTRTREDDKAKAKAESKKEESKKEIKEEKLKVKKESSDE